MFRSWGVIKKIVPKRSVAAEGVRREITASQKFRGFHMGIHLPTGDFPPLPLHQLLQSGHESKVLCTAWVGEWVVCSLSNEISIILIEIKSFNCPTHELMWVQLAELVGEM